MRLGEEGGSHIVFPDVFEADEPTPTFAEVSIGTIKLVTVRILFYEEPCGPQESIMEYHS